MSGVADVSVSVHAALPTKRGVEEPPVGVDRVVAGGEEDHRHDDEGDRHRAERYGVREPAWLRRADARPRSARSPPAIASPISSIVAVVGIERPGDAAPS